ncbi:MAG: cardiolipin synthase [Bacilli bacterium]|nr:cardiolipin synthase [Bacilli bacterium]
MKFLRILFSKWGISALLLILQVAAVVLIVLYLNEYFYVFQIVSWIIGVFVVFFIVNRRENPEYKIPWLFLVLVLPVFGTLFYLMFSTTKLRKKDRLLFQEAYKELAPYIETEAADQEAYEAMGEDYQGLARYLKSESGIGGSTHNDIKYYPVGELMWEDMLEALRNAKKFILMEYFIVDPGKMWESIHEILVQKAKEGVEVHLVYDDVGTVTMLRSGYYKTLRKEGIDAHKFNPFRPIVSGIYNNRDHRKIMVIDGEVGFTGGINLGDEYINQNDRLGHWKDTGIRVKGNVVNQLSVLFFMNFIIASGKGLDYAKYMNQNPTRYEQPGVIVPFGDGPRPIYEDQVGEGNYINILAKAKKYFYITTPYLIIDHRFTQALRAAALRGVDVRIVTPHIPDKKAVFCITRSSYKWLREAGVKVYEYTPGFVHAKMCISDDIVGFIGTINMDFRSLTHHFECGALLYQHECLKDMKEDFEKTFEVSQLIDDSFKQSFGAKLLVALLAVFRVLF